MYKVIQKKIIPRFFLLLIVSVSLVFDVYSQDQQKDNILKVTYVAIPQSQYQSLPSDNLKYDPNTSALEQAYKHYYTLYVNIQNQQSLYMLDSLDMQEKPEGYKNVKLMIQDSIDYVVRYSPKNYLKYEKIFQKEFYSQGTVNDIEWKITNEEKVIYGLNCKKAVPKDEDLLMNVWYTTDIPVNSGPAYFLNLPGLVVRAEDFFWTTEIDDIQYLNKTSVNFDAMMVEMRKKFDTNKKKNFLIEKKLLILKKKIIASMIQMQDR